MRLPKDKFDLDAVAGLAAMRFPEGAPLLDELVAWIADGNWPIARPVSDLLVSTGSGAIPALHKVLRGDDAMHQYFVLSLVVCRLSSNDAAALRGDLERIATTPTTDQVREGVAELVEDILQTLLP